MDATVIVSEGGAPGGATGVHDTDVKSFDKASVPSFFLYVADPLGGAIVGVVKQRRADVTQVTQPIAFVLETEETIEKRGRLWVNA